MKWWYLSERVGGGQATHLTRQGVVGQGGNGLLSVLV